MSAGMVRLLHEQMSVEGVEPEEPVAVAELHKRLLPYHTCRDRLGFATKAEYDAAMLDLLADETLLDVSEPALREAVRAEIRQPEPGLGFLQRFAASEVRVSGVGVAMAGTGGRPPDEAAVFSPPETDTAPVIDRPLCRRCAAELPPVAGVRFCPSCGTDQTVPTCPDCGAEVGETWAYCAFCGRRQTEDPA